MLQHAKFSRTHIPPNWKIYQVEIAKIVFFAAKQIVIYKCIKRQISIFKPDHLLVVVISLNPSSEEQEQYLLTRAINTFWSKAVI